MSGVANAGQSASAKIDGINVNVSIGELPSTITALPVLSSSNATGTVKYNLGVSPWESFGQPGLTAQNRLGIGNFDNSTLSFKYAKAISSFSFIWRSPDFGESVQSFSGRKLIATISTGEIYIMYSHSFFLGGGPYISDRPADYFKFDLTNYKVDSAGLGNPGTIWFEAADFSATSASVVAVPGPVAGIGLIPALWPLLWALVPPALGLGAPALGPGALLWALVPPALGPGALAVR